MGPVIRPRLRSHRRLMGLGEIVAMLIWFTVYCVAGHVLAAWFTDRKLATMPQPVVHGVELLKVLLTVQNTVSVGVLSIMAVVLALLVRHPRVVAIRHGFGAGFRNASRWASVYCLGFAVATCLGQLISPY